MFYAVIFFALFFRIGAMEIDVVTNIEPDDLPTFEEYMETNYLFCNEDQFRCLNGQCISLDLVCNDESDCPNSEDEGGLCTACDDYDCGNKCQNFPNGPRCMCPPHMFLSVDDRTCEFEEQCVVGLHNCSQHCKQVLGHVSCLCNNGYTLVNNYDCELNSEHRIAYLFVVSDNSTIHRFSLFGNSSEDSLVFVPKSAEIKNIMSVTFNRADQMLYFVADEGHRHMKIYITNGVENRQLYFGFGIKHIAADWIANNIYYAADGIGIGVCKGDGRFCRHLITADRPTMSDHVEKFGELIVHPTRGILIWLHYSLEHPNGIIMAAGMDGKKTRILTQLTTNRLSGLTIDYIMDHLYFVEGSQIFFLDLHTLMKHSVNHLNPQTEMIAFNDHLFYVSKFNPLVSGFGYSSNLLTNYNKKTLKEEPIFKEPLVGTQFPLAINNSIYYPFVSNPCDMLECSHMCVLSEIGVEKIPKATCVCPDKYLMDESSNICILHMDFDGPVRTSASYMANMCMEGIACHNGGTCPDDLDKSDLTPFCDCPNGFNGLYCEVRLPGIVDDASSVLMILFLLFVFVIVAIALAVIALKMYPGMRYKFESFSNINMSPSMERGRAIRSNGSSLRQKDTAATPMMSRSPSANFSSSSLLRSVDQPPLPIQIGNSFSNPSFVTSTTPQQQRQEEEFIEREIQITCVP